MWNIKIVNVTWLRSWIVIGIVISKVQYIASRPGSEKARSVVIHSDVISVARQVGLYRVFQNKANPTFKKLSVDKLYIYQH